MTPERARALLDAAGEHSPPGWRYVTESGGADAALMAAAPDLARAYLAAEERAQRAEAEVAEWRRVAGAEVRAQVDADAALASRLAEAEAEATRLREVVDAARAKAADGAHVDPECDGCRPLLAALAALDEEGRT